MFVFLSEIALTLRVYPRKYAGLGERLCGSLISVNAITVLLLQPLVAPPDASCHRQSLYDGAAFSTGSECTFLYQTCMVPIVMPVLTLGEIVIPQALSVQERSLCPKIRAGNNEALLRFLCSTCNFGLASSQ